MIETVENLKKWLKDISEYKTPRVDYLPDISLYMDQVITYMEKLMGPLSENTDDKLITSSMINNYVKGNVIPNPIAKKYSRLNLIYIIAICTLKQVLPIADISKVMEISEDESENYFRYDTFRTFQDKALHNSSINILKKIESINLDDETDLKTLALELAIDATANKMISERILYFLDKKHEREIEEIKKKTIVEKKDIDSDDKKKKDEKETK